MVTCPAVQFILISVVVKLVRFLDSFQLNDKDRDELMELLKLLGNLSNDEETLNELIKEVEHSLADGKVI